MQDILIVLKNKGYSFFTKGQYNLNLIAIRSTSEEVDKFNDELHVIYKDYSDNWQDEIFPITTKPGLYWLKNFHQFGVPGVAILVPGQYKGAFKEGLFNNHYSALVQCGNLKIYRDGNYDSKIDLISESIIEGDYFQICLHMSSPFESDNVGEWSAGCQVTKRGNDFKRIMTLYEKSKQTFGEKVTYTLLTEDDFR